MVVAQAQPRGDLSRVAAVVLAQSMAQPFRRLDARARTRRVDADALLGAAVDGDEDGGVALASIVRQAVAPVPHISSGRSVVIVPSCTPRNAPTADTGRGE